MRYADSDVVKTMIDFEDAFDWQRGHLHDMYVGSRKHLRERFPGISPKQTLGCREIIDWDPVYEALEDFHSEALAEAMASVGSDDVCEFLHGGYAADREARDRFLEIISAPEWLRRRDAH